MVCLCLDLALCAATARADQTRCADAELAPVVLARHAGACAVGIIFMAALAALTLGMLAVAVGVAAKEPDERVGVT